MLKVVAKEVSFPLEILFNRSFREFKFPQIFKESNVIPLPKKGDNSCPSNFRPISLLSGVGKIQVELFHSTFSYHPLSLRTLLFGDQNLSTEDNFIIFRAVHRFIKETKRFDI